ncbi:hypothetical protein HYQ45_006128 [Verticillium longisporum]|uniref:Copper acquisition factor BIM1-like domain-containing protein n=2 Tax=Verticillium TaxID=1036719 RepID=A0A2J8FRT3_VERDA|nr:Putative beta-mannosidase B [Verticillium dahliae VDG1]KAG7136303.1 hypothetical protein HYQ45_006128 [Verticillium longisporum]KAH6704604.1 hypothetical protein EV126DRAFT_193670 [Verticillium dahliae]PNH33483.1 hypothetical protein BJF96_g3250 [Verticillium dahliae]PNH46424.1 hypothetical protein VD0004_g1642 [Verticillium dahliae]
MARLTTLLTTAALALTSSAHFTIEAPDSHIGGSDTARQDTGPCGGHTPSSSDSAVDFHVGGDAIALVDLHAQSDWLIRATVNTSDFGSAEWTQLHHIYRSTGYGSNCQPAVTAPESWVGSRGVINIIGSATDGVLYACATVNFVEGTGSENSKCKNGTDVTVTASDNSDLSALLESNSDSASSTGSATSSPTSAGAAPAESAAAPGGNDSAASSLGGMLGAVSVAAALAGAVLMV